MNKDDFNKKIKKIRQKMYYNNLVSKLNSHSYEKNNIIVEPKKVNYNDKPDKQNIDSLIYNNNYEYYKNFQTDIYNKDLLKSLRYNYYSKYLGYPIYNFFTNTTPNLSPIKQQIKKYIKINKEINNIDDILQIINEYPFNYNNEYNINLLALHKIKKPLMELNNMIGMKTLKDSIVDQILFYIQDLHKGTNDFMHTCIYGPPGTGKTEIAKIMGSIFSKLGILKKNTFTKVTRSDLIAGYLGQTAIKTKEVIQKSLGGVLFIDEAYALGNSEKRDSFAKECIDTLCECLSDNKDNLMVIIAGYEKDLNDCFFGYNQGLNSRFTWRFKTDNYNSNELREIFIKKINEINWKTDKDTFPGISWFENNMDYFKYYGRDMETLLAKVKIVHGRRVFCLDEDKKKVITIKDMNNGLNKFLQNDEVKNRKENKFLYNSMYV